MCAVIVEHIFIKQTRAIIYSQIKSVIAPASILLSNCVSISVLGELSYKKSVSLPRAFANADLLKLQVHVPAADAGMYHTHALFFI